jgi:hypothetical protein
MPPTCEEHHAKRGAYRMAHPEPQHQHQNRHYNDASADAQNAGDHSDWQSQG